MVGWFKSKSLTEVLNEIKRVKIHGVLFDIRKINPMDHMSGALVMQKTFEIYAKTPDNPKLVDGLKKVQKHQIDVFMAGVVKPKLTRKDDGNGDILVDDILKDDEMTTDLYNAILEYTHGKKKFRLLNSQKTD